HHISFRHQKRLRGPTHVTFICFYTTASNKIGRYPKLKKAYLHYKKEYLHLQTNVADDRSYMSIKRILNYTTEFIKYLSIKYLKNVSNDKVSDMKLYHYFYDNECYDKIHSIYASYGESKANYFSIIFAFPLLCLCN